MKVARSWGYRLDEWRALPDGDRDLLLAEDLLVCSRCGNLRSVCSDPSIDWHPQTSTCWASASVEWGMRVLQEKHKGEGREVGPGLHPLDGVSVYATDSNPGDGDEFVIPQQTR